MINSYPTILLVGDSLTEMAFGDQGYGAALVADYAAKCDVLNRGYGGYNTRFVLRKLGEDFYRTPETGPIPLVVIHLGTNDSSSEGNLAVPLGEFGSNLTKIVNHFKTRHHSDVVLLTPATCVPVTFLKFLQTMGVPTDDCHRTSALQRDYADAVMEVAKATKSPVVDCHALFESKVKLGSCSMDELFTEGLHFSPMGYAAVSYALRVLIDKELPHLSPPVLPQAFRNFFFYGDDKEGIAGLSEVFKKQGISGEDPETSFGTMMSRRDRMLRDALLAKGDGI